MIAWNGNCFVESSAQASKGAYIAWMLNRDSAQKVENWLRAVGVQDTVPPEEMHTTIIHSKDRGLCESMHGDFNLSSPCLIAPWVDRMTNIFKKPGKPGVLVCEFSSNAMNGRHCYYKYNYDLEHGFPDYRPHLTLSYNADMTPDYVIDRLQKYPLALPLVFDRERVAFAE